MKTKPCFLSMVILLFAFVMTATAQPSSTAGRKPTRVFSPVENLLGQARTQRADHQAGFLRPIKNYSPMLAGNSGRLASLRNPFAAPAKQKVFHVNGNKEIWGSVINSSSWADMDEWSRPYGVYSFNLSGSDLNALATDPYSMNFNGGAVFYGDALHGINYYEYDGTIYSVTCSKYNMSDWSQDYDASAYSYDDFSAISYAVAYDPTTGKVYAFSRDNSGTAVDFSTLDLSAAKANKISTTERTYVALAINASGSAYAIGLDGILYSIDKSTGTSTAIGSTGITPAEVLQCAAFDPKDGTLYWAAINADKTSSLYTVNLTTGEATKVHDFANGEEFVALYIPVTADPNAPAPAENVTPSFENGSLTGTVSFDIPTTTAGGTDLTGNIDWYVIADDIDTLATGADAAGSHVTASVSFDGPGKHKITVVLHNEAGNSNGVNADTGWIGNDKPYDATGVTLTIDDNGHATLTWDAVTTGWNDGYIDTDNITYTVISSNGDTLANHTKNTILEFDLTKGDYRPYSYVVRTYNGDVESEWGSSSNVVKWGNPLDVPYENAISSYDGFNILDFINGNNGGFRFRGDGAVNQGDPYGDEASDAWLILPPINLKGGHSYYLAFDAATVSDENTQKVEAGFGTDLTVGNYTKFISPTTVTATGNGQIVRGLLKVTADNVYRLGIHDISDAQMDGGLIIKNVSVTEGPSLQAPDSVTNIRLTADASGQLIVNGSFTAPSKDINGDALTSITKIEVYRSDSLISTITGVNPGGQASFTDNNMPAGKVSYTIVAYNESGRGIENSASTTAGVDYPAAPGNVAINDNFDGTANMTWDAPTIGRNGRAIIPDELTYNIYQPDGATLVASDLSERSFEFSGLPTDGEQYATGLYVAAKNSIGEGDKALGLVYAGTAYKLPFKESFAEGTPTYNTWMGRTSNSFQIFSTMSQDDDGGCIAFIPNYLGEEGIITSGKISLAGSNKPKLSFYYWGVPRTDAEIKVLIGRNGIANPDTAKTFSLNNGDQGWQKVMVDLTPYKSDNYITVQFYGMTRNSSVPPIIDNIVIDEAVDNDLAVSLNAPSRVNVGAKSEFEVKVSNEGNNDADDAVVNLLVNDSIVASKTVSVPSAAAIYPHLDYVIPANLKDNAKVQAKVVWAPDENADNNSSNIDSVKIIRQDIPSVSLTANLSDDLKPELSWQAPSSEPYTYTDGFENYDPFSIANVGNWTLFDGDSATVSGIGGAYYDHMFEPCAFMVFNPALAGLDLNNLPQFGAHSGDQYMTTFSCGSLAGNNDWLISPELSGRAQTISFYCRSVDSEKGLEKYEVLYSTTGTSPDDFTVVREKGDASADGWEKISVELPEGAKYFAIHCTSSNQFMFMVDDVTYEGQPVVPTAYNIYRNGQLIATVDAGTTTWTDDNATENDTYIYNVTVVTDQGEGNFSNDAQLIVSGINNISADDTGKAIHYNIAGQRLNQPQRGVNIIRKDNGETFKVIKK